MIDIIRHRGDRGETQGHGPLLFVACSGLTLVLMMVKPDVVDDGINAIAGLLHKSDEGWEPVVDELQDELPLPGGPRESDARSVVTIGQVGLGGVDAQPLTLTLPTDS